MSTIATSSGRLTKPPKFRNGEQFLQSLGDVPMSRIVWDPVPGTATEQDLLTFVERDKRLCELIDGTLVEKPMGSFESAIAAWLIFYLNAFLESNPIGTVLGEAGMMRLFSGRVRMPDVSFISNSRLSSRQLRMQPIIAVGPDLAVEVISDSNTKAEISQKKVEYFESGTKLVWVIYPLEERVEIFLGPTEEPAEVLGRSGVLNGAPAIPGFTLELEKLFSKLPK
jgi:Uma2 family endonuclease